MAENILVVSAEQLRTQVGSRRFKALPEEEIDRLYGCVEVMAMEQDLVERDPTYMPLVAFTAIHHNYSWFTRSSGGAGGEAPPHGERTMGVGGLIEADDHDVLFLDDHLKAVALRVADEEVIIRERCDYRLAGLLNDDSSDAGRARLGLVYVAQLRRPGVEMREQATALVRFSGMGELQQDRDQFDSWSQVLIDNLQAL